MADWKPRDLLVWDNHACMPLRPQDETFLPQLERLRASGVDVVSLNVGFGDDGIDAHVRMLAHLRSWIGARADRYALAATAADIRRARADGKLAVVFDVEGMNAVADQPSMVQLYYELGVRWMLVAYNRNNRAGGGCQDDDTGLTDFGRAVIDEMQRVGMVVCCTHTGYRTAAEVIDHVAGPVIFSHSNPRALHDHPRNVPDELLAACARKGGVICLSGIGLYLGDTRTETLVRHIEHVIDLVGDAHVGLGLDYVFDRAELDEYFAQMTATFPPSMGYGPGLAMTEPERTGEIYQALAARGHGGARLARLFGGNLLRIAETVWR